MANSTKQTATLRKVASATEQLSRENKLSSPIVQDLRKQTANAFVLYANYKHYHWQTHGPHFRDYHKLFDEFAADVLETLDPLAERVRMIGPDPPAHPLEMVDLASAAPAAPGSTMREMIEEAMGNALIVVKELRKAAHTADEHEDPGTVDLFSKIVQVHEKHEWWLRDILQKGDGMST